ncbi:MAG: hypothetical protein HC913_15790 [Microscillaceae bacterium]|nr:hypothetical protein [Microscillaceae bacterium]
MKNLQELVAEVANFVAKYPEKPIFSLRPTLAAYQGQDWQQYIAFEDTHYTRQVVCQCPAFEILVLGWQVGQGSPFHNHAGQGCLLRVMQGVLHETRWQWGKTHLNCYTSNAISYIDDQMGVHQIENRGPQPAVSLHIYAPGFFCAQKSSSPEAILLNPGISTKTV